MYSPVPLYSDSGRCQRMAPVIVWFCLLACFVSNNVNELLQMRATYQVEVVVFVGLKKHHVFG